jgi:hypothetical protein
MEQSNTQQADPTDRIGTARIGKLLLDFSVPAIVGMVVGAVLGAKTWDGWASSVDPEFGAKIFFNPTFSLGWTF